jgi:hypothetical protein
MSVNQETLLTYLATSGYVLGMTEKFNLDEIKSYINSLTQETMYEYCVEPEDRFFNDMMTQFKSMYLTGKDEIDWDWLLSNINQLIQSTWENPNIESNYVYDTLPILWKEYVDSCC